MIRRNRIAVSMAAGLAVVVALGVWTSNAMGADPSPVAQTENSAAGYNDIAQAPVLQEPPAATPTDTATSTSTSTGTTTTTTTTTEAPPPVNSLTLVGKSVPKMGEVVQDGDGRTLYRFDKDSAKPPKSNCNGQCEATWPPLLAETPPQLQGVNQSLVGTVTRADGKKQVTLDGWPLYTYSKDDKPGAWKGQGVGGTWFVVQPDGKRNVECLPPGVTAPAA